MDSPIKALGKGKISNMEAVFIYILGFLFIMDMFALILNFKMFILNTLFFDSQVLHLHSPTAALEGVDLRSQLI